MSEAPKPVGPVYRPEPESTGSTPDLFAQVRVTDEDSLGRRLLQQGADLYCDGKFPTFRDRLRQVIVREKFVTVVCGRDAGGRVETYAQAFWRVTGEPLVATKSKRAAP